MSSRTLRLGPWRDLEEVVPKHEVELLFRGTLRSLQVEAASPIWYWLTDGYFDPGARAKDCGLNWRLGRRFVIRFTGSISCVYCGRRVRRTVGQGFCYPCFRSRPEADVCLFKPERCHYDDSDNPCRDPDFGRRACLQPHILYASLTSGVKVGITRKPNLPRRWIDQGAVAAMPLAELPSRREVGEIEHRLSSAGVNDRTHWMRMLREEKPQHDLEVKAAEIVDRLESWGAAGILPEAQRRRQTFTYPVMTYPTKITSIDLDKTPKVEGTLVGIKGQYLIFDHGVLNVRRFTGYQVAVLVDELPAKP